MKKVFASLTFLLLAVACASGEQETLDPTKLYEPMPMPNAPPKQEEDSSTFITSKPDAGDASLSIDVGTAPLTMGEYVEIVANVLCDHIAECCYGAANPPGGGGGGFDRERCLGVYRSVGWDGTLYGAGGRVTLDQAAAVSCITKLDALTCDPLLTTTDSDARATCFASLVGTVANGGECATSAECLSGHFCHTGVCEPLRTIGGTCSIVDTGVPDIDMNYAEEACSYKGNGQTGLRCDSYDFVAGEYRPRSEWTCQPQVALGEGCNVTSWCSNGLCSWQDYTCVSEEPKLSSAPVCVAFLKK
jgi:hypothetical protein